ncbi:MAG: glycosyltransferase family 4 protein [Candidatus Berkelbacteria bacterium]|nr:glycosyltransferase family 4 protein [Candidatus Berkelbacteria bacterium]
MSKKAAQQQVRVFSLVKGFHGGVARYTAMLSRLNERPGVELQTVVINSPGWLCNRGDLEAYDLEEIMVRGRADFSWIDPCVERINHFSPDLLLVHGGCVASGLAWLLQRKVNKPLSYVSSYHGFYTAPKPNRKLIAPVLNWLTPKTFQHRALSVVAVADFCKSYLISHGVDAEKITVVHNGINSTPPKHVPIHRPSLGLKDDDIVIGVISRLDPVKGLSYLIDAITNVVRKHPNVHLVMVGDGNSTKQLQQQCRQLGITSNVHFVGYQADAPAWFELFDIFALPSLAEFHSISLLEAMRAGNAIVATDVGGNTESVRDEKEALIVPSKDSEALERALIRLIENPELAYELSQAASRRFHQQFTINVMLDRTEMWLRQCVQLVRP